MSANVRGTIGGTRKQRGAEKLPEEFPNTWADAWDGYEYTMLAEGQSTNSTRTRRSSVLRLAKAYPRQEPETLTRRDIERHITGVRLAATWPWVGQLTTAITRLQAHPPG